MNNFKKVEIKAYNRNEAVEKAPFQIIKDATQAWKNAGKPITGDKLKEFMANYLNTNTKFASGIGCMITIESGVSDTRERPYSISNVKNEQGTRKYKTVFEMVDKDTNEILGQAFDSKNNAMDFVKSLYADEGYRGKLVCLYKKVVVEGEPIAFEAEYTPSINAKEGTYLAFGVESND